MGTVLAEKMTELRWMAVRATQQCECPMPMKCHVPGELNVRSYVF